MHGCMNCWGTTVAPFQNRGVRHCWSWPAARKGCRTTWRTTTIITYMEQHADERGIRRHGLLPRFAQPGGPVAPSRQGFEPPTVRLFVDVRVCVDGGRRRVESDGKPGSLRPLDRIAPHAS